MAISLPQRLQRLKMPSFKFSFGRILEPLVTRQPIIYRVLVTLCALAGYLLLILFPLVALFILADLPGRLLAVDQWRDGLWLGVNLLILLLAGAFSIPLIRNRFTPPRGLEINQQNAPKLWQQVEQLRQEYKSPAIDNIILCEGFSVEGMRTPRFKLPLRYHTTLIIGLEGMLTLPPDQFKTLLARRIGQLSGTHHRYINWLAGLRQIWPQYHQAFRQQKGLLSWPLRLLFALYAPFYSGVSFYIARQNELEADRYALDIASDDQLAGLFSQLIVTETFLKTRFWPKITQLARRNDKPGHLPYSSITQVLRRGLTREDMQNWIKTAYDTVSNVKNPTPLLQQRLEHIGHHKPTPPRALHETAADYYIGPVVMQKIIDKFDQHWLLKIRKH